MTSHVLTAVRTEPVGMDDRGFVVRVCSVCPGSFLGQEDHDEKLATASPSQAVEETGTRDRLPHWIEQRVGYGGQVFIHGVMLGFTRSEWPVQAFAADEDGGCSMGARWAAERPDDRVLVGPVLIPDSAPVRSATRVPPRFELR